MNKRSVFIFMICCICLFAAACGPSDEKIAQAQEKYSQLVEIHNQAVEAHKDVADDSLDESLTELQAQAAEVEGYNLAELKEEEIDMLIQIMDNLIASYEEHLEILSDIKDEEEAAALLPIPLTVINNTEFSFSVLKLYEKEDYDTHANVLEDMELLSPGQALAGLVISRDVDNTPWILELEDTNGIRYELELLAGEYDEEGVSLELSYNAEEERLMAE